MTYTLSIEPVKGRKGRIFTAYLLNFVTADNAWESGSGDLERPVYLAFTATDSIAQAITANLRTGRRAVVRNEYGHEQYKVEFLKKSGHRFVTERCRATGGSTVTVYLPELFELDPGLIDQRVCFLFAPATWWVEREASAPALADFSPEEGREFIIASYFAAYLDRRSPLPIINDPLFHRQLYRAAREEDWWSEPHDSYLSTFRAYPEELVGLDEVALIDVDQATFEEFLRRQTSIFYEAMGPSLRETALSPTPPPLQLSLFDVPGFAPADLSL